MMVRVSLRRMVPAALATAALAAPLGLGLAGGSAVAAAADQEPTLAQVADSSVWGANGRVMSIVPLPGNRVALGGGFSYLGPSTGHSAVVGTDGKMIGAASMVNGDVSSVVPDGSGGYFVAGEFTQAADVARRGVAHLKADGTLDRSFRADVKGSVLSLGRLGNLLVIGGSFTTVNGTARTNLAAVDATTGALSPLVGSGANGAVQSLLPGPAGGLYVGGSFSSVLGSARQGLARMTADGGLDPVFAGRTNGAVRALATSTDGTTVYAGGDFTSASGTSTAVPRARLAAFAADTGAVTGWAPAANSSVTDLATHASGTVYAAGSFTSLGGGARTGFGAVDGSGTLTSFAPVLAGCHQPHTTKDVYALPACSTVGSAVTVAGDTVYLGGNFSSVAGVARHDAAAFDATTGAVTGWNPSAGGQVNSINESDGAIFLGGQFTSVNGLARRGLAVLDVATGQVDPTFTADVAGMVLDVEASPDGASLYVAGSFTEVGGVARSNAAKVSATTGALVTSFNPAFNNTTIVAAVVGDSVYYGGKFSKVSRLVRGHAAKLSAAGQVDPTWVVNTNGPAGSLRANGMVQGIEVAPDGSKVYLAGPFNSINGVAAVGGIAVRNGTTGAQVGTLGGVVGCSSVGPWINRLYLSPDGRRLYGGDVCPDYIYQWDAVNLSSAQRPTGLLWRTWCNAGMQGAMEVNGHFYYGSHGGNKKNGDDVGTGASGRCSEVPGGAPVQRSRLAVFSQTSGNLLDFTTLLDTPMGVWSFAPTSRGLLMGGDFTVVGDRAVIQQSLALLPGTP